jgi:hypothetical protein
MIPLSPNEEAHHFSSHLNTNRVRRLQEVRRQAREFQASQLDEYRRAQSAASMASDADHRRRELLAKTAELQRLRSLRAQAMRDVEAANREAQLHATRIQSRRDIQDIKLSNFETREASRAAKALTVNRAVREAENFAEQTKLESLAAARAQADATSRAFVAPTGPDTSVDVEAVLGNVKRHERKFRFLELAEEISDSPHEANIEPPRPKKSEIFKASERGKEALAALRTREKVAEISDELKTLQAEASEKKVTAVVLEQSRRVFRRPFPVRKNSDPEIEIFVPKRPPPPPQLRDEISDQKQDALRSSVSSSKLSEASLDALVNRYSEILQNFRSEDPGEELVTSWDFNK